VAAPKKPANNAPVFGRWQGVRLLESGGFGQTIEVKNLDTKKFAIVKVIKSDHYGDEYEDFVRRFKREMKFLSEMDHPNICRLYEANFDSTSPWFAMERYKGNTVAEELDQYGPAPEKIWFDRARDILSALEYAHSKKIIHGDLNPGNVIIDGRGAKLIDFGISRRDGAYSSNSTKIFGANGWTSPEYGALPPAIEDDIFVAASLLVKLGTGNHAFKANTVNNYLPSIIKDDPDYGRLSTNQIQLLRKMHEKSRSKRCSATEALALIDRLEPSASSRPIVDQENKVRAGKKQDGFQNKIQIANEVGNLAKIAFYKPLDLVKEPTVQSGGQLAAKYKGLTIASVFFGGAPLVAYWLISKAKRTKHFGYDIKFPLANSALAYCLTFGILAPKERMSVALKQSAKDKGLESKEDSPIVEFHRSWEEVEKFFVHALSNKRGKRFIFEIESEIYTDIYFQGYSEPDLSRTIEAAADLSVRPKLSDKQKLSMSVIGWDLPSEDLPNFIMFLESNESGDHSVAQIFTKTLREGYGLEPGTFRVLAPDR